MIRTVILGLATELVRLDDVRRALSERGDSWLRASYTEGERTTCLRRADPVPGLAARLAAKTAALTALGGTRASPALPEIEIVSAASGRPSLVLHGSARSAADRLGVHGVHVSLTHSEGSALAVVIMEGAA